MIIEPTQDPIVIKSILTHPDIYPVISSDLAPNPEDYEPTIKGNVFLVGRVDDVPIALFILYPCNDVTAWCHVQVLPEYRKEYAYKFGLAAIAYAWDLLGVSKLVAQIPAIYPNVIAFAERCGFKREGVNTKSHLKDGKLVDCVYVGLERQLWDS